MIIYESLDYPNKSNNMLEWQAYNEKTMSTLSKLAMKYLGIPEFTIKSVRTFSIGGQVVGNKRTFLNADKVEALIICKENMKLLEEQNS